MARARKATDSADTVRVRLSVRTVAAMGELRRYRAGLGPFTREPQVVWVEQWQAEALRGDPFLAVEEAGE